MSASKREPSGSNTSIAILWNWVTPAQAALQTKIAQHNAKVINGTKQSKKAGCNCLEKNKADCPIPGDCKAKNVIYRSIVTGDGNTYGYIGMTGQTFKQRFYGHQSTFRDEDCRRDSGANKGTALSAKVWEMKDKGLTPKIEWDIIDRVFPYKAGEKACDLCRLEKMQIALGTKGKFTKWPPGCTLLNKRSEIMAKCLHKRAFTLANV